MRPSRRTWRTAAASAVVVLAVLGLVVVASPAAARPGDTILDAEGFRASTGRISRGGPSSACPPLAVEGFTVDNPVYEPFPVCSRNGLVDVNRVVGGGSAVGPSTGTGINVGDDGQVTVRHNSVSNHVIGVDNLVRGNTPRIDVALLPYHLRPFTDHALTTWGLGANWACFPARLAEPFPEAPSRERCGREWALARGSDVATGRQCCGRLEEGTHG